MKSHDRSDDLLPLDEEHVKIKPDLEFFSMYALISGIFLSLLSPPPETYFSKSITSNLHLTCLIVVFSYSDANVVVDGCIATQKEWLGDCSYLVFVYAIKFVHSII
ncbi:hypothetical protein L2E82_29982 [Cichorium intybus]|uniref:Uncharacterized protein n=1 Tax=Cichorium intybus TaxID=13427 RepID=A0ACB9CZF1_CICIN|nr:hypothetical protein L2E82_29982 [Cichorium intybus]